MALSAAEAAKLHDGTKRKIMRPKKVGKISRARIRKAVKAVKDKRK
jgi:hypothetical protein